MPDVSIRGKNFHFSNFSQVLLSCVGVSIEDDAVLVLNTRDPDGPMVEFNHKEWDVFIKSAKLGEFDL